MSNLELQDEMFQAVEECNQSGLSRRAYCIANNMNEVRFQYWVRKYRKRSNAGNGFIKIENKSVTHKPGIIEVIYPNGVRLYTNQTHDLKNIISCW